MKRKIALFMACAMTALSIAACGNGQQTGNTDTGSQESSASGDSAGGASQLRVAWWGNQVRNERTDGALKLFTEQNPDITFENEFTDWGGYWDKLATQSAGNELPDIVQMDYKYLAQYANNDLLVDLTPYIEDGTLNLGDASEDIVKSGQIGGKTYAVCLGINAPSLVYNKKVAEEAGITVKDNMSLDEFVAASKNIYEKTGVKTNLSYGNGDNFIEYFVRDKGYVLFEEGKLGVPDESVFVDFFHLYKDAIDEGWLVDPSLFVEITPGTVETDPLTTGKSWVFFCYSNQLSAITSTVPEDMELGITTWPAQNPKQANYLKPSQFFCITSDCENVEAAVKVLDFFTNSVEANEIMLAERGVPISASVAESIKPQLDEVNQLVFDYINQVVTPNSSAVNPASSEGASEAQTLMNNLVEQVCYGQKTPEDAGKELFEQGNELLAKRVK